MRTNSARTVLVHAEKKHIVRAPVTLAVNSDHMRVPEVGEQLCFMIDGAKEKMMEEPNMRWDVKVEAVADLQLREEHFPFLPEASRNVVPQPLNASVVHAPEHLSLVGIGSMR